MAAPVVVALVVMLLAWLRVGYVLYTAPAPPQSIPVEGHQTGTYLNLDDEALVYNGVIYRLASDHVVRIDPRQGRAALTYPMPKSHNNIRAAQPHPDGGLLVVTSVYHDGNTSFDVWHWKENGESKRLATMAGEPGDKVLGLHGQQLVIGRELILGRILRPEELAMLPLERRLDAEARHIDNCPRIYTLQDNGEPTVRRIDVRQLGGFTVYALFRNGNWQLVMRDEKTYITLNEAGEVVDKTTLDVPYEVAWDPSPARCTEHFLIHAPYDPATRRTMAVQTTDGPWIVRYEVGAASNRSLVEDHTRQQVWDRWLQPLTKGDILHLTEGPKTSRPLARTRWSSREVDIFALSSDLAVVTTRGAFDTIQYILINAQLERVDKVSPLKRVIDTMRNDYTWRSYTIPVMLLGLPLLLTVFIGARRNATTAALAYLAIAFLCGTAFMHSTSGL